jgi:hypothetical protein
MSMLDCMELINSPKLTTQTRIHRAQHVSWRHYAYSLYPILNITGSRYTNLKQETVWHVPGSECDVRCHFIVDYREMYVCIMKVNNVNMQISNRVQIIRSYWQKCWRKMILNDRLDWCILYCKTWRTVLYNNSLLAWRTVQAQIFCSVLFCWGIVRTLFSYIKIFFHHFYSSC